MKLAFHPFRQCEQTAIKGVRMHLHLSSSGRSLHADNALAIDADTWIPVFVFGAVIATSFQWLKASVESEIGYRQKAEIFAVTPRNITIISRTFLRTLSAFTRDGYHYSTQLKEIALSLCTPGLGSKIVLSHWETSQMADLMNSNLTTVLCIAAAKTATLDRPALEGPALQVVPGSVPVDSISPYAFAIFFRMGEVREIDFGSSVSGQRRGKISNITYNGLIVLILPHKFLAQISKRRATQAIIIYVNAKIIILTVLLHCRHVKHTIIARAPLYKSIRNGREKIQAVRPALEQTLQARLAKTLHIQRLKVHVLSSHRCKETWKWTGEPLVGIVCKTITTVTLGSRCLDQQAIRHDIATSIERAFLKALSYLDVGVIGKRYEELVRLAAYDASGAIMGFFCYLPSFNPASLDELYSHTKEFCSAFDLAVVLFTHPCKRLIPTGPKRIPICAARMAGRRLSQCRSNRGDSRSALGLLSQSVNPLADGNESLPLLRLIPVLILGTDLRPYDGPITTRVQQIVLLENTDEGSFHFQRRGSVRRTFANVSQEGGCFNKSHGQEGQGMATKLKRLNAFSHNGLGLRSQNGFTKYSRRCSVHNPSSIRRGHLYCPSLI